MMSCGLCRDDFQKTVMSPDGRYSAIEYYRDCGATTSYVTHVKLHRNNWWGSEQIVWTAKYERGMLLTWRSPTELEIDCDTCSAEDIYVNLDHWKDVKISFSPAFPRRALISIDHFLYITR